VHWLKLLSWVSLIVAGLAGMRYYNRLRCRHPNPYCSKVYSPREGDRILVFSPHPDDEAIAVGGYIYTAARNGATVRIVLITDGNKQGLKDKRYTEFSQAAALLGVPSAQLVLWGFPDGRLNAFIDEVSRRAEEEIHNFQPGIILYPHPLDRHPDHSTAGRIVEDIIKVRAGNSPGILAYRFLIHYWFFPRPGLLAPNGLILPPAKLAGTNDLWQMHYLDPETRQVKKNAVFSYRTQLRNPFLLPLLLSFLGPNELLEKMAWGNIR